MTIFTRRDLIKSAAATTATLALPSRLFAQSVPEIQTLRSTSKSWLWAAEDYATARGFFDKAKVKVRT